MHKILIFLHIPKCGGTTINRAIRLRLLGPVEIIREIFRPRLKERNQMEDFVADAERSTLWRRFCGWACFMDRHKAYGSDHFLSLPCGYVTVLRKPESWVVSAYHFSRRENELDISLEDFVRSGRKSDRFYSSFTDNVMVRMICGEKGVPVKAPIGECTREMLELAKKRVDDEFLSTMVLERLDESILCLCKRMRWRDLHYVTSNVNRSADRKKPVTAEQLQLIREYNQLDIELYEYANRKLDEAIETYGEHFRGHLDRFVKANRRYSKLIGTMNEAFSKLRDKQAGIIRR